jgi:hypothetical protein
MLAPQTCVIQTLLKRPLTCPTATDSEPSPSPMEPPHTVRLGSGERLQTLIVYQSLASCISWFAALPLARNKAEHLYYGTSVASQFGNLLYGPVLSASATWRLQAYPLHLYCLAALEAYSVDSEDDLFP